MNVMEELEAVLAMLDEVMTRVERCEPISNTGDEAYILSGIRTAKSHVFRAYRAVNGE